jgi:hypothetical protein
MEDAGKKDNRGERSGIENKSRRTPLSMFQRIFVNAMNLPQSIRHAGQSILRFTLNVRHVYRETKITFPINRITSFGKRILTVIWCLPFLHRASMWLASPKNPLLFREFSQAPEIREFIFRPYVNRHWTATQRLNVIEAHYNLVSSSAVFLSLAPNEYVDLVMFDLKCGNLRVVLDRPKWMRREGELGLSLFLGIHRIYTVMFLLSASPANMKLIIGCVQGVHFNLRENPYKELTKELHGIRPRDFIIHITKIISRELGCDEILGISDASHRSLLWCSKATKVTGYDTIWLEHGGKKVNHDFYSLPSRIIKRTSALVDPRKRALYRRSYQFLDDLHSRLREVIASPPPKKRHQWAL